MLPAYVANMSPVLLAKLLPKWNWPIDGGKTRDNGTRILGPGKTWRGLVGGSVVGALVAWVLAEWLRFSDRLTDFGQAESGWGWAPLLVGFGLGYGALLGDAVKSFFKRRLGKERGAPWIGPDQLDFVVGGLAVAAVIGLFVGSGTASWTNNWLIEMWYIPLFLMIVTPLLHWLVNVIGYKLGLKAVPW